MEDVFISEGGQHVVNVKVLLEVLLALSHLTFHEIVKSDFVSVLLGIEDFTTLVMLDHEVMTSGSEPVNMEVDWIGLVNLS